MSNEDYFCPECGSRLELYANGDTGPGDDRWTCDECEIEYPHCQFPLPPGYVRDARIAERMWHYKEQQITDRIALEAWNKWARESR